MEISNKEFERRLRDTMAWHSAFFKMDDLEMSLRSEKLRPKLFHDREAASEEARDPYREEIWFQFLMGAGEQSWEDVIDAIVKTRRSIQASDTTGRFDGELDITAGKLLLFEDDISELDGKSGKITNGYFNPCDVAPWDTWVTFLSKGDDRLSAVLISWVAPELVKLVEQGVADNTTECLWLTDVIIDLPEIERLRAVYMKDKIAVAKPKTLGN